MIPRSTRMRRSRQPERRRDRWRASNRTARGSGRGSPPAHERGVGAEHDHLAMRMLMTPITRSDGEADGGRAAHRPSESRTRGSAPSSRLRAVLDRGDGVGRGLLHSRRLRCRQSPSSRARPDRPRWRMIALASILSFGFGRAVEREHDGARASIQRPAYPGVGFLGGAPGERRQRVRVLGFEHGLRRFPALPGSGASASSCPSLPRRPAQRY